MKYADIPCTQCTHPLSSHRAFRHDPSDKKQCKERISSVPHALPTAWDEHCGCYKSKPEVAFDYQEKEREELFRYFEQQLARYQQADA